MQALLSLEIIGVVCSEKPFDLKTTDLAYASYQ